MEDEKEKRDSIADELFGHCAGEVAGAGIFETVGNSVGEVGEILGSFLEGASIDF